MKTKHSYEVKNEKDMGLYRRTKEEGEKMKGAERKNLKVKKADKDSVRRKASPAFAATEVKAAEDALSRFKTALAPYLAVKSITIRMEMRAEVHLEIAQRIEAMPTTEAELIAVDTLWAMRSKAFEEEQFKSTSSIYATTGGDDKMTSYKLMIPPEKGSRWNWIHFRHYTRTRILEVQGQKKVLLDHAVQIVAWFGRMAAVKEEKVKKKPEGMAAVLSMFAKDGGAPAGSDEDGTDREEKEDSESEDWSDL